MVPEKIKNPNSLPQAKQHALNILEKTATNTNNPCVVWLLWEDGNVELPDKKTVPSSFLPWGKKFKNIIKNYIIEKLYKGII